MEAELEALRRQLKEKDRRLEDKDRKIEEEVKRRQAAEEFSASSAPSDLNDFLWACHNLSLAIRVVTDPSETTKGDTAEATCRYHPSRVVPWTGFVKDQANIWDIFQRHPEFLSKKQYASLHQLEYVGQKSTPISAEMDLRYFERDTVEHQVKDVVDAVYDDEALRQEFNLRGPVTFESHTNLKSSKDQYLSSNVQHMAIEDDTSREPSTSAGKGKEVKKKSSAVAGRSVVTRGQADRFCIYRQEDENHVPAMAIEYKAPHKLSRDEIATGLTREIQPARDVIGKDGEDVEFCSRRLVTVVITQLFSYMVNKGIRYGYVCTGETFIFLRIQDDPSTVEFAICVPNIDVRMDQEEDCYRTAVAQVAAFTLRALAVPPPMQEWFDAVANLGIWPVEYSGILAETPESKRQKSASKKFSAYYSSIPQDLPPLQMKLRSRSRTPPPPPSPSGAQVSSPSSGRGRGRPRRGRPRSAGTRSGASGQRAGGQHRGHSYYNIPIEERPYCSQKCILALKIGGSLDPSCPNFKDHRKRKIPTRGFHSLIRHQLATNRGITADCCPLYKQGSTGALFKVRLSSHGFTMVAKGMTSQDLQILEHERHIYDVLRDIQGVYIPVCLGIVQLEPKYPYYYNGGVYTHMLFLSWAGKPLSASLESCSYGQAADTISHLLDEIHQRGVLHGDAEPRNTLWDDTRKCLMMVDFERASIRDPLSNVSLNMSRQNLSDTKRKNSFSSETRKAQCSLARLEQMQPIKKPRLL